MISDFTKNPLTAASLGQEISEARVLMARRARHTKRRVWLGGNHEDRMRRFMWKNAAALARLPGEDFPTKFGLGHYGFEWRGDGGVVERGRRGGVGGRQQRKARGCT